MSVILKKGDGIGFFSVCSVRLERIIEYINKTRSWPTEIISHGVYHLYSDNDDIFYDFFVRFDLEQPTSPLSLAPEYSAWYQYRYHKTLPYTRLIPYVKKYFTPTKTILDIKKALIDEYSIQPDNCLAVYYRGTDKKTEISLASFNNYYNKIQEAIKPKQQLLIQTDDANFLDFMKAKSLDNLIVIKQNTVSYSDKGVHNEKTPAENCEDIKNLLATMLIVAECKEIIFSISNISHWITLFRGNVEGIHQWIGEPSWESNEPKNIWV